MSIDATKEELNEVENCLAESDDAIEIQKSMLDKIDFYYEQFVSWAEEFDNSTLEQQKMIICQLIRAVRVSRGYNIEIEFNASYRQFFSEEMCLNEVIRREDIHDLSTDNRNKAKEGFCDILVFFVTVGRACDC